MLEYQSRQFGKSHTFDQELHFIPKINLQEENQSAYKITFA